MQKLMKKMRYVTEGTEKIFSKKRNDNSKPTLSRIYKLHVQMVADHHM